MIRRRCVRPLPGLVSYIAHLFTSKRCSVCQGPIYTAVGLRPREPPCARSAGQGTLACQIGDHLRASLDDAKGRSTEDSDEKRLAIQQSHAPARVAAPFKDDPMRSSLVTRRE
jgi:hypothetical protein